MNLPIKMFLSILLSVFLFSISFVTISANHQQSYRPPPSYTPPPVATSSVAGATQGQVLGCSAWNPLSWGSCVGDAAAAIIDAGVGIIQNVFIRQTTGCNHDDRDCQENALREIENGVPVAEMDHPGALIILASALDSAKTMPIPIDSGTYFASINPFRSAQAAGADELASSGTLLKFWQIIRNASYALMVLVLVVIGFMIMFRVPLNPRMVVTAENSLPRVAVSLLLITFSFAISGFLLDIGRVAVQLVGWFGAQIGIPYDMLIIKFIGLLIFGGIGFALFGGIAVLLLLLLALFLLIIILMIAWKMITRMAMFIVLTLFAPLIFMLGAVPKGEGMIFTWFKRQLANVLAIPAMLMLINMAMILGNLTHLPGPIEGKTNPFGLASIILGPMIAIGVLMMATKVPEMLDDAFGLKESGKGAGLTGAAMIGAAVTTSRLGGPIAKTAGRYLGRSPIVRKTGLGAWMDRRAVKSDIDQAKKPGAEARRQVRAGDIAGAQETLRGMTGGIAPSNYTGRIAEQTPEPAAQPPPPPPPPPQGPAANLRGARGIRRPPQGGQGEDANAQAEANRRINERRND